MVAVKNSKGEITGYIPCEGIEIHGKERYPELWFFSSPGIGVEDHSLCAKDCSEEEIIRKLIRNLDGKKGLITALIHRVANENFK